MRQGSESLLEAVRQLGDEVWDDQGVAQIVGTDGEVIRLADLPDEWSPRRGRVTELYSLVNAEGASAHLWLEPLQARVPTGQ